MALEEQEAKAAAALRTPPRSEAPSMGGGPWPLSAQNSEQRVGALPLAAASSGGIGSPRLDRSACPP